MSVSSLVIYITVQYMIYFILGAFYISEQFATENTTFAFAVQILSTLSALLVSLLLKHKRWGFRFSHASSLHAKFMTHDMTNTSLKEKIIIGIASGVVFLSFNMIILLNSLV